MTALYPRLNYNKMCYNGSSKFRKLKVPNKGPSVSMDTRMGWQTDKSLANKWVKCSKLKNIYLKPVMLLTWMYARNCYTDAISRCVNHLCGRVR